MANRMNVKPKFVYYINVDGMSPLRANDHIERIKKETALGDNYENEQWYFVPVKERNSSIEILHL